MVKVQSTDARLLREFMADKIATSKRKLILQTGRATSYDYTVETRPTERLRQTSRDVTDARKIRDKLDGMSRRRASCPRIWIDK
jgi:hypothetical protein